MKANPDNPSNIRWENLGVGFIERTWRELAVFFCIAAILLGNYIIMMISNSFKQRNVDNCDKINVTYANVMDDPNDQDIKYCYCKSVSFADITSDQNIKDLCWSIYMDIQIQFILSFVSGFIIQVVNYLLQIALTKLSKFERYSTFTKEMTGRTFKLFVAMLFNTTVFVVLVTKLTPPCI